MMSQQLADRGRSAAWLIAIVACCCLLPALSRAQQLSQYTQYVFNHFSVNPAVAGSKDCLDIKLGFRKQWVGFEGAPTTAWASVHGAIRAKDKPFQPNHHGIGVWVEADDTGPLGYTLFYLAYAYHIQMSSDYFMSLGTFAGLKQMKMDAGEVTLNQFNDPAIDGSKSVFVYPEITPGIWLYNKVGWCGLAMHQVLGNKIKDFAPDADDSDDPSRLTRHFLFSAGYRYKIGKKTTITPSTLMKFSPASPMALDLNLMLDWKRAVGIGASYRNTDAMALMMKVAFLKFFTLGYSYDITTSKIKVASSNTHEIILGINPCPPNDPRRDIVRCPVWE